MVDLGHDVARPLGLDPLEALVSLHLDPAGLVGQVDGQLELRSEGRRPAEPSRIDRRAAEPGRHPSARGPGFEGDLDCALDRPVELVERQVATPRRSTPRTGRR